MKLTQNKTNVLAPSGTYPYGNIKDDSGSNDGTPVNVELMQDYVQFFEKMFNMSGLTANGNPDNESNGYQLVQALFGVLPKKYVKQIVSDGDSDTITIAKSEIQTAFGDNPYFSKGFLGASTSENVNVDFLVEIWILNGTIWTKLRDTPLSPSDGQYKVTVNDTTGDITILLSFGSTPVDVRIVLIG